MVAIAMMTHGSEPGPNRTAESVLWSLPDDRRERAPPSADAIRLVTQLRLDVVTGRNRDTSRLTRFACLDHRFDLGKRFECTPHTALEFLDPRALVVSVALLSPCRSHGFVEPRRSAASG